jgi:hypothetical protein
VLPSSSALNLKIEKAGYSETSVPGINIQGVILQKTAMSIVEKLSGILESRVIVKGHAFNFQWIAKS